LHGKTTTTKPKNKIVYAMCWTGAVRAPPVLTRIRLERIGKVKDNFANAMVICIGHGLFVDQMINVLQTF
jgi:hypothetical protein